MSGHSKWTMIRPNVKMVYDQQMVSYLDGYILAMVDVFNDIEELEDINLVRDRVRDSIESAQRTRKIVERKLNMEDDDGL